MLQAALRLVRSRALTASVLRGCLQLCRALAPAESVGEVSDAIAALLLEHGAAEPPPPPDGLAQLRALREGGGGVVPEAAAAGGAAAAGSDDDEEEGGSEESSDWDDDEEESAELGPLLPPCGAYLWWAAAGLHLDGPLEAMPPRRAALLVWAMQATEGERE